MKWYSTMAIALAWLAVPASSFASEMRHHSLPAIEDYVVSVEAPTEGPITYYNTRRNRMRIGGSDIESTRGSALLPAGDLVGISITVEVFDEEITLDGWLAEKRRMDELIFRPPGSHPLERKIHDEGFNNALGQRTYFRRISPLQVFEDGEYVRRSFRKPLGKDLVSVFDGRVRVELNIMEHEDKRELGTAEEALFDRIAASVDVSFEELFESFRETELFTSRTNWFTFDPIITGDVRLQVPVDWIANEGGSRYGDLNDRSKLGRTEIEITHYDPSLFSGPAPRAVLVIEGLPPGRVSGNTYDRHAESFLRSQLKNPRKIDSREVSDAMQETTTYAHCMSKPGKKHEVSSDGITATTYTGKDLQGNDIKALHYRGGGSHVMCNYLYTAGPEAFDATAESIEAMLKTVDVEMIGPWFQQ